MNQPHHTTPETCVIFELYKYKLYVCLQCTLYAMQMYIIM